MYKVENCR